MTKKAPMSKLQAVLNISHEEKSNRRTKTSLKRLRDTCKALELTDEETRIIESRFEYRPSPNEDIYSFLK